MVVDDSEDEDAVEYVPFLVCWSKQAIDNVIGRRNSLRSPHLRRAPSRRMSEYTLRPSRTPRF